MKANWEKLEKNNGLLTVEVDADQVNDALDKAFKKVVRTVNLPGFRKGRVPRQIFEAKFGVESLYQDALDILLPDAYIKALEETNVEPIAQPEIDFDEFNKGASFTFTAKVQVKPDVTLGEYKGLEIPEQDLTVSDEEVEQELNATRDRQAELVVIEEGAAENGDTTVIDFEGFTDGVPFEGGKGEKHSLELGSGSFIPGFEEQVVGMSIGEEKDINVTFPEEYQSEDLAGKDAVFKVVLHEIKRKSLPELDDEFAKDVSEFETLDEYKADIAQNLKERNEKSYEQYRETTAVEKASANAEVDVPDPMVETELKYMLDEFESRLRMQGMSLDIYYQFSNQDESALKEQMRGDAISRVRQNLVLEAIAKAEGIEASNEELDSELERLAGMYQSTAEDIKERFTENGTLDSLKKDIAIRNTVKFLVEESRTVPAVEDNVVEEEPAEVESAPESSDEKTEEA